MLYHFFIMKHIFLFLAVLFFALSAVAQNNKTEKKEPKFNIKQYWLVMIKTGPQDSIIKDSSQRATIFAGHFSNMEKLHKEGILKVAGPFGKNDFQWRGLFILDCATKQEAEKTVATDPAVAAGIFVVDIVPWFTEPSGNFKPGKPPAKKSLKK